jgi:hypothetical protein
MAVLALASLTPKALAVGELSHRLVASELSLSAEARMWEVRLTHDQRWPIALLLTVGLLDSQAFADCVPSPDIPASVIEYFRQFNKPLPERFCTKEDYAPQASEESSQERAQTYEDAAPQDSEEPSQEPPQAYEDVWPPLEHRGDYLVSS